MSMRDFKGREIMSKRAKGIKAKGWRVLANKRVKGHKIKESERAKTR